MKEQPNVVCIAHPDGRFLYHVSDSEGRVVKSTPRVLVFGQLADGTSGTMDALPRDGWYASRLRLHSITISVANPNTTVRWELEDTDAESVRFPRTLTPEEFSAHPSNGDSDLLYEMYRRVTEEADPTVTTYEGPFPVMEGGEAPDLTAHPSRWVTDLPHALAGHPEYGHLYPGRLHGLKHYLHQVIGAMPGVQFCFKDRDGRRGLNVTVQVPYDPPRSRRVRNTGARGQELRTFRDVPEYKRREVDLPVPEWVTGENYEDARAKWDEAVEHWTGIIRDLGVTACGHCGGTGHADTGVTKYERKN